jgi:aldehyde dehydrogenase (NAD+)
VGGHIDAATRYVAPTITVDPNPDGALMRDEIFGPILPVIGVDGPSQAKAFIGARPKPLALYVFAERDDVIDDIVATTTSGGVCVNQTLMHLLPPDLPFGGVGDSGMGAYHGKTGFDAFTHYKSVLRKPTKPDLKLLYPPYSGLVEKLVRRLAR